MRKLVIALLAVLATASGALAEERAPYSQAELDQMLAPIALYPDALLSQVLMAATYPLEVVEAARWSRAHSDLKGEDAVRAVQDQDWDPSVKSLLAFPDLLTRMDEELDWTRRLGDAFLEQEPHVMQTVQRLRRKAEAAGQLGSGEHLRVLEDDGVIVIEQANPRVVYVPYYDPLVVYGAWWWPAHPPVVWAPWSGYTVYRPGIWWGVGVGISSGFFYGGVRWIDRRVVVVRPSPYDARPLATGPWRHNPAHRRGIVYRHPETQRRFAPVEPRLQRPAVRQESQREERRAPPRAEPRWQPREERRGPLREEQRWQPSDDHRRGVMPPALRTSPPQPTAPRFSGSQRERGAPRAVPYDRGHGWNRQPVDRAHGVGRVRPDAPQYRAAQPDRVARHARRDAGAVPVRPAVRAGMAGDRPRMAR